MPKYRHVKKNKTMIFPKQKTFIPNTSLKNPPKSDLKKSKSKNEQKLWNFSWTKVLKLLQFGGMILMGQLLKISISKWKSRECLTFQVSTNQVVFFSHLMKLFIFFTPNPVVHIFHFFLATKAQLTMKAHWTTQKLRL